MRNFKIFLLILVVLQTVAVFTSMVISSIHCISSFPLWVSPGPEWEDGRGLLCCLERPHRRSPGAPQTRDVFLAALVLHFHRIDPVDWILEILTYYQKTWMKKFRSYQNTTQTILNARSIHIYYVIISLYSRVWLIKRTKFGQHFKYWDVSI